MSEYSGYTRTIHIRSYNLGVDTRFFLTFNSDNIPGIYETVYPTVWKVTEFLARGGYQLTVTFKSQLGVSRAQVDGGIISPASTYIPINVGQKTILTKKNNAYFFSAPTAVPKKDKIVVENKTGAKQDLGVGFFPKTVAHPPTTTLLFKPVDASSSVHATFKPLLRGYVDPSLSIEEDKILTTRVKTPVLFSQDLSKLDDVTYWKITYNERGRQYEIEQVEQYDHDVV